MKRDTIWLMHISVVDIFCGIGGLSYGFRREGFEVKAGIDSDPSCQYAFESNLEAPFLARDVREVKGAEVKRLLWSGRADYRVLIGCAPCAPFSLYTSRYRKAKRKDKARKWELLREFSRIALATKPDVVSMENVLQLRFHRVFRQFIKELESCGYHVTYFQVRADHYGVPQRRSRLVLFASKFGPIQILPETHLEQPVTVRKTIGKLPPIPAGGRCERDPLHRSRAVSDRNLRRLRATAEGGSWKDWPEELQLKCHKQQKGKSFRSVYGRMKWESVGSVITTECLGIGNGRFGHPEQDRAISIREAALLQTFPKKFRFVQPRQRVLGLHLARQIGNAVPVRLGQVIARSIKRHLASLNAARRACKSSEPPSRNL